MHEFEPLQTTEAQARVPVERLTREPKLLQKNQGASPSLSPVLPPKLSSSFSKQPENEFAPSKRAIRT